MAKYPPTLIDFLLVEPEVQVRVLDLEYQAEQYALYHRRWPSRIVHGLCMVPNVAAWFLVAAAVPKLPWLLALALFAWYFAMERLVGLVMLPFLAGAALAAEALHRPWQGLALMALCSLLQTVSHAWEEIPPPWSGRRGWVPFAAWFRHASLRRIAAIAVAFASIFVGLEWFSSPRLLAVQVMAVLGRLGYRRDFQSRAQARAKAILDVG